MARNTPLVLGNYSGRQKDTTIPGGFGRRELSNHPISLTSISPITGKISGYDKIYIRGKNLKFGTVVRIGGTVCPSSIFVNSTLMVVETPAKPIGIYNVQISFDGDRSVTLPNAFEYLTNLEAPTITSLTPDSGNESGGYWITLAGTNLRPFCSLYFGETQALSVAFVSLTEIKVEVPPEEVGVVDVQVVNYDLQEYTKSNGFEYIRE